MSSARSLGFPHGRALRFHGSQSSMRLGRRSLQCTTERNWRATYNAFSNNRPHLKGYATTTESSKNTPDVFSRTSGYACSPFNEPYIIRENITSKTQSNPVRVDNNAVHVGEVEIPNIWLRDNCQCGSCMHQDTKQRLLDTFQLPHDIAIKTSSENANGINVEWSDGHKSCYTSDLLREATYPFLERSIVRQGLQSLKLWGSEIKDNPPTISYKGVISPKSQSLRDVTENIRKYGFSFIDSVPYEDGKATEELLERIAFIRNTHYGGFYDFTADLASKDTAYTSIALEAHTDNTYFSDPAGLQAFHLLSHTEGEGGASLLVDGFKVAKDLKEQDPDAYEVLSTVNVYAHASGNEGISIQPYRGFPVFQHDPATGALLQVRWNSSDRTGIELPVQETVKWYDAARKFDTLLKKQDNEYWEQLTPGKVVIFDNWRVMHGRSAFTGKRRICGAYINRDDWISKYKMLKFGQDEVLKNLTVG